MQEKERDHGLFYDVGLNFDLHSIRKDIMREWWTILLLALSVGMATHVMVSQRYSESYTTKATLFVTTRGTSNTVYNNLLSAQETAAKFSQILNSNLLQKKVAEEIGMSGFSGTAYSNVIENTNLLEVRVTAGTPDLSFKQMQSILKNYNRVSDYLLGDAILEVLQAPEVPAEPDAALHTRSAVQKSILGTLAVLILILAGFSFMKDTIRSDKDVDRKLDAKRLGTIAHENKYKTVRSRFRKAKSSILLSNPTVSFRYVETMKKLSRKVKNLMDDRKGKSILITSVLENEGKSTVAVNLALALSQESKRVLLIDCDFRKPSQYKVLEMQNEEFDDFGAIINGQSKIENLVNQISGTDLYCILNTMAFPNSTEMITAGILRKVIDYFSKEMDYIILDTSPMALVADAEEINDMTDASLLVVKQHLVEAKDLNDAIDVLNAGHSKLLGCVFNDAHVSIMETSRVHGYGHGYGGHYE